MPSAVEGAEVVFRLDDPAHELKGVRLWQELGLAGATLDFAATDGGWELRLARPTVHRMEYLFEVDRGDGDSESVTDPTNPHGVGGAFGAHSVLELPGYTPPPWEASHQVESQLEPLTVDGAALGADIEVQVWSPADAEPAEPLPLLVAHDGPEMAAYAGLTRFVAAMVAADELPRLRVALLAPGDRNRWYAADLDYAAALTHRVLAQLRSTYTCAAEVVLTGVSLGALAALHAEWAHPGTFAGLFLQSGSFFTPDTDPQERDFDRYAEVTGFVDRVLTAPSAAGRPAVALSCGSAEENVANNRVMAARLAALGWEVSYAESPDVHNFTAWRDVLDPHLTALLQRVWS